MIRLELQAVARNSRFAQGPGHARCSRYPDESRKLTCGSLSVLTVSSQPSINAHILQVADVRH